MIWNNNHSVPENCSEDFSSQRLLDRPNEYGQMIDLNLLLNRIWKYYEGERNLKMATRFDPMPFVDGDEGKWKYVFNGLFKMIMLHPPKGFFFLHIKCEPFVAKTANIRQRKGLQNFQIHFHANISANEHWHRLYDDKLKEIAQLINAYKGAFAYNCCVQDGCVFSITLPGKLKQANVIH